MQKYIECFNMIQKKYFQILLLVNEEKVYRNEAAHR